MVILFYQPATAGGPMCRAATCKLWNCPCRCGSFLTSSGWTKSWSHNFGLATFTWQLIVWSMVSQQVVDLVGRPLLLCLVSSDVCSMMNTVLSMLMTFLCDLKGHCHNFCNVLVLLNSDWLFKFLNAILKLQFCIVCAPDCSSLVLQCHIVGPDTLSYF